MRKIPASFIDAPTPLPGDPVDQMLDRIAFALSLATMLGLFAFAGLLLGAWML